MKDEREQMQEYLKQYTNANSDIQKPKSVDKAVKGCGRFIQKTSGCIGGRWNQD